MDKKEKQCANTSTCNTSISINFQTPKNKLKGSTGNRIFDGMSPQAAEKHVMDFH
jgi:hypothetical protein